MTAGWKRKPRHSDLRYSWSLTVGLIAGIGAAVAGASTSAAAATLATGYRVVATTTSTPLTAPGGTESPLGSQRIGTLGTIMDGPVATGAFQWWNVDFETGADGWVTDQDIDQPYFPPADNQGGWRALVGLNQTPTSDQKSNILATTGVDWDQLKLASDYSASFGTGSVVLVIRNGFVVGNWGDTAVHGVASVSKSLTGLAWAKLFDQSAAGTIATQVNLASPAYPFLPSSWAASDVRKKDILIEHLLTMSSGLQPDDNPNASGYLSVLLSTPVKVPPATEWSYASIPVDLSSVAHTSITGQKLGDYLNAQVAQPIGVTSLQWIDDFSGYTRASSRAGLTVPDLARFGYLMLMNGAWQSGSGETQIISAANAAMLHTTPAFLPGMTFVPTSNSPFAINPDSQMYYGHLWWTNRTGAALGTAVPPDAYFGRGFSEAFVVVIPSENLVVVRYGNFPNTLAEFGREFMARVMPALSPQPLPAPLAYWKLDEGSGTVIGDSSGNNFTGTAKNGTAWTTGRSGSALLFDGVNDFADFAKPSAFANLPAFTVAGWINPDPLKTKTFATIAAKSSGSGATAQKRMLINNSTTCQDGALGCLEVHVNRTSADAGAVSPPGTLAAGTWQYVVFTYSSTDGPRIYKDGVEVTYLSRSLGSGTEVDDAAGNFLLGSWGKPSSPSGLFKGKLDDVRLYNAKLSASEVAGLYQSVTTPPAPTPLAYWKLDEGSGTVIGDSSGNNFTGTAKNGTAWTTGTSGSALLFDGVNDFADFAKPSAFANLTAFTVAGWINPDPLQSATFNTIAAKSSGRGATAQKRMLINNSTTCQGGGLGCLEFSVNRTSALAGAVSPPGTVAAGAWQYVVFAYSSADGPRIYKDGVEVAYQSRTVGSGAEVDDANGNFLLGSWGTLSAPSGLFKGRLDDVRLYNSELSATEVATLYQSATGLAPTIASSINSGGGLTTMTALRNAAMPALAGALLTSSAAADPASSIKLFDATAVVAESTLQAAGTTAETSPGSPAFATQRICLELSADDAVVLSSTRDGTGSFVIDGFLAVDGRNVCEAAPGQSAPQSCSGPQIGSPLPGQDIREALAEIPPLDITDFVGQGRHKYTFELKSLGTTAGSTDLFLSILGSGRFCSVLPQGPDLDLELHCTRPGELSVFVRNRGDQQSPRTRARLILESVSAGESRVIAHSEPDVPRLPADSDPVLLGTVPVGDCPDPPRNDDRCDFRALVDTARTTAECSQQGKIGAVCESDESNNTEGGTIGRDCGGF